MSTVEEKRLEPVSLPSDNLRILIVDDGRNAADILAMFFEMEGHQVKAVYSGAAAVEAVVSFQPHLILMDIAMPDMDGLEASRRIRQMPDGERLVIVALSGLEEDNHKRSSMEAGINRHMAKPILPNDLRALIRDFQNGRTDHGSQA